LCKLADCDHVMLSRRLTCTRRLVLSCLVLMNNWQTSSWSITPMGGGGALWRATGTSCAIKAGDAGYPPH